MGTILKTAAFAALLFLAGCAVIYHTDNDGGTTANAWPRFFWEQIEQSTTPGSIVASDTNNVGYWVDDILYLGDTMLYFGTEILKHGGTTTAGGWSWKGGTFNLDMYPDDFSLPNNYNFNIQDYAFNNIFRVFPNVPSLYIEEDALPLGGGDLRLLAVDTVTNQVESIEYSGLNGIYGGSGTVPNNTYAETSTNYFSLGYNAGTPNVGGTDQTMLYLDSDAAGFGNYNFGWTVGSTDNYLHQWYLAKSGLGYGIFTTEIWNDETAGGKNANMTDQWYWQDGTNPKLQRYSTIDVGNFDIQLDWFADEDTTKQSGFLWEVNRVGSYNNRMKLGKEADTEDGEEQFAIESEIGTKRFDWFSIGFSNDTTTNQVQMYNKYTFPNSAPAAGDALVDSDGDGVLEWGSGGDYGSASGTTDASGDITVSHSLGTASIFVTVTVTGTTPYLTTVHSKTSTTFKIRFFDTGPSAVTSTAVTADWIAKK